MMIKGITNEETRVLEVESSELLLGVKETRKIQRLKKISYANYNEVVELLGSPNYHICLANMLGDSDEYSYGDESAVWGFYWGMYRFVVYLTTSGLSIKIGWYFNTDKIEAFVDQLDELFRTVNS